MDPLSPERHLPLRAGHEILEVFPLVGARFGEEHGVRLELQELVQVGRSTRCRAESAFSVHRGDGRGRDVDAELQERGGRRIAGSFAFDWILITRTRLGRIM